MKHWIYPTFFWSETGLNGEKFSLSTSKKSASLKIIQFSNDFKLSPNFSVHRRDIVHRNPIGVNTLVREN